MRSAYPSSYSFFDSTSDSIRVEDIQKCSTGASFSSLSDLFTNPSPTSDLFPNARTPVFVPEEVRFPAKKKRECEERTSIWHEWGSGECQTENVAQESSGFSSDLPVPGGGKCSVSSSDSFPNLGSANISLVTEEFTFPARKKREEGSSWREERASFQDWSTSGAPKESTVTERCPVVGSITDMYLSQPCTKPLGLLANSKASPFSSLATPVRSTSEEVSFPARKKREERSFWREASLDGVQSDGDGKAPPREVVRGVSSLAEMYFEKPGSKYSSLFPNVTVGRAEDVVFPKRKNHADRNVWRDWTNAGYGDYEDETDPNSMCVDHSSRSTYSDSTEFNASAYTSSIDGSVSTSGRFSAIGNSPSSECVSRASKVSTHTSEGQVRKAGSGLGNDLGNVDESGCLEACMDSELDRSSHFNSVEDDRTMDGGEPSDVKVDVRTGVDDVQQTRFTNSRSEQRSGLHGKYPPPLRSLSRQGLSRVPHHMPWVQLQPIRSEGRFVLKEVKVTQPVVFQPIREEGRLVLQLIGHDNSYKKGHAEERFDASPAIDEEATIPKKVDSSDSVTKKTEFEPEIEIERREGRLQDDRAIASAETKKRKQSSKVWPIGGSLEETEESGRSANGWSASVVSPEIVPGQGIVLGPRTPHGVPPKKLPEEGIGLGARDAAGVDMWDRKSLNLRELCILAEDIVSSDSRIPERERPLTPDGAFAQDRPPPWLLGKVSADDRKFDARSWNNQLRGAVEKLGQTGNVISIPRARETAPLRVHFQALPRTSTLRNAPSGLNSAARVDGEPVTSTRSRSVRSSSLPDIATVDSGKEEKIADAVRGRASDARVSLSMCQGIVRDSFLTFATAHSFLRSLRMRPCIPGERDPRMSTYPVAAAFSCADGMGERHHEKNFWEQLPCVS